MDTIIIYVYIKDNGGCRKRVDRLKKIPNHPQKIPLPGVSSDAQSHQSGRSRAAKLHQTPEYIYGGGLCPRCVVVSILASHVTRHVRLLGWSRWWWRLESACGEWRVHVVWCVCVPLPTLRRCLRQYACSTFIKSATSDRLQRRESSETQTQSPSSVVCS